MAIVSQLPRAQPAALGRIRDSTLPKYIPEIDGLRALAVLGVIGYHLSLEGFSLGWTGVMLFFVISGFLITGILLDARDRPGYFRNFYVRRTLRILPIYYLTLAAVVAGALLQRQQVSDLPYYLAYAQNYVLGITDFQARFPMMFNHSWSLALEEQFYLLWPATVLLLGRRKLLALVAVMFMGGFLSRVFLLVAYPNPTLMYASLPTELDSLAVGAGLALLARSGLDRRRIVPPALVVFLASGAVLWFLVQAEGLLSFWHPEEWTMQFCNLPLLSILALFWGSVLALAVFGSGPLSAPLRIPFLRHVGKISYGLYMYHFPVFVVADNYLARYLPQGGSLLADLSLPLAKLMLTYALALASWRLIESPLLGLKERFRPPS